MAAGRSSASSSTSLPAPPHTTAEKGASSSEPEEACDLKPCQDLKAFKSFHMATTPRPQQSQKKPAESALPDSQVKPKATAAEEAATAAKVAAGVAISTSLGEVEAEEKQINCPPDGPEIGRATWTFLHSMAAYFPDKPTSEQKNDANEFLRTFSKLYPCNSCASHMRGYLSRNPAQTDSRHSLALWMCQMHNEVNERLGKPQFDCSKVDERWRDGPKDGSCDI